MHSHHSIAKLVPEKDAVAPDGLRFKTKEGGTPFQSGLSMSCFRCGVHRVSSALVRKRILGASRAVCAEPCQKAK